MIGSTSLPPRRASATIVAVRPASRSSFASFVVAGSAWLLARLVTVAALAAVAAPLSCKMSDEPSSGAPSADPADRATGALAASASPRPPGVAWIAAPDGGDVASIVKREAAGARSSGRALLVYVGATWCEPCQHFHHAVASGALDKDLAGTSFLEFDADRDRDRLRAAGYASKFIPLFVLPGSDGRSSGRFIEGSIKGDGAAAEITPRLRGLIGR